MRPQLVAVVIAQVLLLAIELFTNYDTGVRQAALVVTNLAATAGLLWLDRGLRRRGGSLTMLTILFVITAVWLDALGNFQHLYAGFWWWDRVTHAAGGLAVSALFMDLCLARRRAGNWNVPESMMLWYGFLLGQFVAAMYEVSEWLGDMWFATERVRGPFDSPRDLFFNAVGGVVVVFVFWLMSKNANRRDHVAAP